MSLEAFYQYTKLRYGASQCLGLLGRNFQTATWTVSRTPRTPGKAAQAAQTGFPGPQAAQTSPQAAQTGLSGRPSCWNGLQECSCRHCSCRQNTALWPCQTGPRPSRQAPRPPKQASQAPRPPRKALQAAPAAGTASKNVLVDATLLSRQHLALVDTDNLQDCCRHNMAPVDKTLLL